VGDVPNPDVFRTALSYQLSVISYQLSLVNEQLSIGDRYFSRTIDASIGAVSY
jgi:hypothetical protein